MLRTCAASLAAFGILAASPAYADCVLSAKSKTTYTVVDSQTLILSGGIGNDILIKIYCCVLRTSRILVLQDDFCSYSDKALYIDGRVTPVAEVTSIPR